MPASWSGLGARLTICRKNPFLPNTVSGISYERSKQSWFTHAPPVPFSPSWTEAGST